MLQNKLKLDLLLNFGFYERENKLRCIGNMQKNMQKNVEENLKVKIQDKKWYALFVKTGEEENVKSRIMYRLGDKDINVIVPKRCVRERRQGKWENKIRILFPGYILLNGNIS